MNPSEVFSIVLVLSGLTMSLHGLREAIYVYQQRHLMPGGVRAWDVFAIFLCLAMLVIGVIALTWMIA